MPEIPVSINALEGVSRSQPAEDMLLDADQFLVSYKDDSNRTISASTTAENIKEYVNNSLGEPFNPDPENIPFYGIDLAVAKTKGDLAAYKESTDDSLDGVNKDLAAVWNRFGKANADDKSNFPFGTANVQSELIKVKGTTDAHSGTISNLENVVTDINKKIGPGFNTSETVTKKYNELNTAINSSAVTITNLLDNIYIVAADVGESGISTNTKYYVDIRNVPAEFRPQDDRRRCIPIIGTKVKDSLRMNYNLNIIDLGHTSENKIYFSVDTQDLSNSTYYGTLFFICIKENTPRYDRNAGIGYDT